jgi:hypothetical protein
MKKKSQKYFPIFKNGQKKCPKTKKAKELVQKKSFVTIIEN